MKYKSGTRRRAKEYEADIAKWWKDNQTFEKSIDQRHDDYVFYDGPPFITGSPHHGTLLASMVKDAVARYWTMNGKRVERRWGWDCHGLPAENFVEKQLDIEDRRQIGAVGPVEKDGKELPPVSLDEYITKARESMVANSELWEGVIDRIGRWVDFKGAYRTMDKDFMESVWWAFKQLYDKGKIYEGRKVLMYDTKFATPVSKSEVTMDNDAYQTVTDPSVYVKFELTQDSISDSTKKLGLPVYLMAWTTTPWTLPGNTAAAVNPELDYVEARVGDEILILAKKLIDKALTDEKKNPIGYEVISELKGDKLVSKKYKPIFGNHGQGAHQVYAADYVEAEAGTGIVHLAPCYGEEDYALALKSSIPVVDVLDENGYYLPETTVWLEKIGVKPTDGDQIEVWEASKFIAKCLKEQGVVWKIDYIQHEYPFNPRSKQRIMYRAIPSWFFDVDGSKSLMMEQNQHINWFPEHIKNGRFAKNIEAAPDWNLSRDRFWATAMPVWRGNKGALKVVGSYDELYQLSGQRLEDYHRPWVDEIEFDIAGEHFKRIDKVLDCWFESGSMPFAQFHYPFENKEKFEKNYPADFITEYVGQVRAWFYYVHAVNTALFGENAFKNVIVTGTVAGNDGRKMSKSLGNFTNPNELMDKFSADSLRFLLLSGPPLSGEDFALQDKDVGDVARKLSMIWNMYDFFTMYAEVDGWEFSGDLKAPENLTNPLDIWIISRLYQTRNTVTKFMNEYNLPDALSEVLPFIDDASNWFVRRSRRRFWKSEDDTDKEQAYQTLHFVLGYLALILAPFTPFLAEEIWHKLVDVEGSVHLQDWPEMGEIDKEAIRKMASTRGIIEKGLALRMERNDEYGQIKVRQPLASMRYVGDKLDDFYEGIIEEEVNVKEVINYNWCIKIDHKYEEQLCRMMGIKYDPTTASADLFKEGFTIQSALYYVDRLAKMERDHIDIELRLKDNNIPFAYEYNVDPLVGIIHSASEYGAKILNKTLTSELRAEGLSREVIRFVQNARKNAGLNIDDRINLKLSSNDHELQKVLKDFADVINSETLAIGDQTTEPHTETVKVGEHELSIQLSKV